MTDITLRNLVLLGGSMGAILTAIIILFAILVGQELFLV